MNELTLTQLGTLAGLMYTLWQFANAKAQQVAEIADLKARLGALENQAKAQDAVIMRIERSVNSLVTTMARLEERLTALDEKLSAQNHPHGIKRPSA